MPRFRRVKNSFDFNRKHSKNSQYHLHRPELLKMLMQARHRDPAQLPKITKDSFLNGIRFKNGNTWITSGANKPREVFSSTDVWLRDRVLWKPKHKRLVNLGRPVTEQIKHKYSNKKPPKKPTVWKLREWSKRW